MIECDQRDFAFFGFYLDGLMSRLFGLFEPDAFRRLDDLGHVRVEPPSDYDVDARLLFHLRADTNERQSLRFLLIAKVGTQHFPVNNPSFVSLAEIIEESDPLFAWDLFAKDGAPPAGSSSYFQRCGCMKKSELV